MRSSVMSFPSLLRLPSLPLPLYQLGPVLIDLLLDLLQILFGEVLESPLGQEIIPHREVPGLVCNRDVLPVPHFVEGIVFRLHGQSADSGGQSFLEPPARWTGGQDMDVFRPFYLLGLRDLSPEIIGKAGRSRSAIGYPVGCHDLHHILLVPWLSKGCRHGPGMLGRGGADLDARIHIPLVVKTAVDDVLVPCPQHPKGPETRYPLSRRHRPGQ